jgi:hypothetical protein
MVTLFRSKYRPMQAAKPVVLCLSSLLYAFQKSQRGDRPEKTDARCSPS